MAELHAHEAKTASAETRREEFVPLEPDPLLREPRPLFGNQIRWARWVIRESRRERAFRRSAREAGRIQRTPS